MRYSTNSKLMAEIVSEIASIEQHAKMIHDNFASLDHSALTNEYRDYFINIGNKVERLMHQLARLKSNSYKMQSKEGNAQTHYDNDTKRMRRSIEKINKASKK